MKAKKVVSQSRVAGYRALALDKDNKIRQLSDEVFIEKAECINLLKRRGQKPLIYEEIRTVITTFIYE